MKGIGKRVTIGFLSIVALLSVSGMISLFELSNLSYDTETILSASRHDIMVAKDLLRSAHDHSRAALDVAIFGDVDRRKACEKAIAELNSHIGAVRENSSEAILGCVDTLSLYAIELNDITEKYGVVEEVETVGDSVLVVKVQVAGREWYNKVYEPAYDKFGEQVKRYVTLSHGQMAPRAEQLSKNAYRSVTPVLISLSVMIALVLMLYFFVYIYGVKPIITINKALANFVAYKMPYKVKAELIDELREVSDNIETLANISKLNKKEEENAI